MKNHIAATDAHTRSRGQSMVEVALFLPIFLIIIAGLVEVSQMVLTQNRVSNATRVGARFGANGGEDEGILNITLNSVTQTLDLDEAVWDVWVIRVAFDQSGDIIQDQWEFNHVYGLTQTVQYNTIVEADIQANVRDQLYTDQNLVSSAANAGGLEAVGILVLHDIDSILGLNALPFLQGFNSIRSLNLMRVSGLKIEQTNGCSAFPIAVEEGIRNVTSATFPDPGDFTYPDAADVPAESDFPNNDWDETSVTLRDAHEGTLFFIQQGSGSGNFGWLRWNQGINASAQTLSNSMSWPGDSTDYTDQNDGGNLQRIAGWGESYIPRGYINPANPTDQSLHINDLVAANTGSVASVGNGNDSPLISAVDSGQTMRVIVWDWQDSQATGVNDTYRVSGFAIMRLHGYRLSQGNGGSWILAEFIRWDTSCGQQAPTQ